MAGLCSWCMYRGHWCSLTVNCSFSSSSHEPPSTRSHVPEPKYFSTCMRVEWGQRAQINQGIEGTDTLALGNYLCIPLQNICTDVHEIQLLLWKIYQCRTRCGIPSSEDHELEGWTCGVSRIQQPPSPPLPPLLHSTQVCKGWNVWNIFLTIFTLKFLKQHNMCFLNLKWWHWLWYTHIQTHSMIHFSYTKV